MTDPTEVCMMNIGPRQRRRRLRVGLVLLSVGAAAAAVLITLGIAWPWRLALHVPFASGAISVMQWREKT
ncbi:MAG: hypothetical protein EXR72_00375 [Myxococcales bacterium]|nr:hypothetical protein [Myxococcales bacterium]